MYPPPFSPPVHFFRGGVSQGGFKPTTAVVIEDYDRAAPKGVGAVKVAGNYAADMMPNMLAKQAGYPIGLYLDAKTNTLVEVCDRYIETAYICTAYRFGVAAGGSYASNTAWVISPLQRLTNSQSRFSAAPCPHIAPTSPPPPPATA